MLVKQKGFWNDVTIANTRKKLTELYSNNPDAFKSDKKLILAYWATYENVDKLLGDKWESFANWFSGATSPETLTRCLRGLKEDGTIRLNQEERQLRNEKANAWRGYWSNKHA